MIVRRAGSSLHLMTQPDHAALAARIMRDWRPLQQAPRRATILLAIEEHDNGWREADEAPTVDPATGRIHDFVSAPAATRRAVWPRGVARLGRDPWAAALVAHHAITVYERYRADGEWQPFFSDLEKKRNNLVATTPLTLDTLIQDYDYVRIGDLISLIFCNEWQGESYKDWGFRRDGDRVIVTPDAFEGRTIPIGIYAREIADRVFTTDAELHNVLRTAPIVRLAGEVAGM